MDPTSLPDPLNCSHHLFREPFTPGRRTPEPTDLCDSPVGMVHMVDCPLTLGRPCTYFEAADAEREVLTDDDVVLRRNALHDDFMRWNYRQRIRALTRPLGSFPRPIPVESVPEPDVEAGADLVFARAAASDEAEVVEPEADAPPAEVPEERYPGQRRSEDRRVRAAARSHDHAAAPSGACCDDEPERDEFPDVAAAPEAPRTIDELFASLPEAVLPERPARRERRPRRRRSGDGAVAAEPSAPGGERTPNEGGGSDAPRRRRGRRRPDGRAEGAPQEGRTAAPQGDAAPKRDGGSSRRGRRRRRPPRSGDAAPPSAS